MSKEARLAGTCWRCEVGAIFLAAATLASASAAADGYDRTGRASWYGKQYHGRSTASGERFDENALTAAHRNLPFGTLVWVTNLANHRSLVVRINDRGPFAGGRIIDVSRRAARILGFERQGIARVRVQTVRGVQQTDGAAGARRTRAGDRARRTPPLRDRLRLSYHTERVRLHPPPPR